MQVFVHASLYGVIAAAAWTYGRTRSSHRVVALLFAWELLADMARLAIAPLLDAAPAPYDGGMLLLYYLDHALVVSFRFAVLAASLRLFERASIRPALYGFAATVLVLVIVKESTQVSLIPVHAAIAAGTVGVSWVLAGRAVLARPERMQVPDGAHVVLLVILALLLVKVCLHYFGPVQETWSDVLTSDTLVHGLVAVAYLAALVRIGVRQWRPS